jgi:hypothetical protein
VVVPPNAVKYNIGSSKWPFCGDDNFLSVVVEMKEDAGAVDDGSTCTAADCADAADCTDDEEAAITACAAAHGQGEAACEAAGCTYAAGAALADCTAMVATNDGANADQCPVNDCVYTAPVAATCGTGDDGADTPAPCAVNSAGDGCEVESGSCAFVAAADDQCVAVTADTPIESDATLTVKFKGRSPNFDVCSSDSSCLNFKFGKIEERGPDGVRKVNAHSIMSLASRNNLPVWSTGTTSFGNSNAVTWVKMELDRCFSRGCSNSGRDGGAPVQGARPRPARRYDLGTLCHAGSRRRSPATPRPTGAQFFLL